MKRFNLFFSILAIFVGFSLTSLLFAQDSTMTRNQVQTRAKYQKGLQDHSQMQHGYRFVDENGDGYNDNAPDHDGDGIPNGLDPDYTGPKMRSGNRGGGFIDLDGDGINDNMMGRGSKGMHKNRKGGYGPADGTGNQGVRPQDGTGFGPGSGSGNCDGTGPKGNSKRGGRK